ncbi:type II toxin-antitoxin system VapC family toxin [uncultured Desulfobacter sp.]|uniref:type II toxin-antitoxin system tRNA(fMet)-specific endonuclease VapC n=1 Tax=uncultured Desulfobacter sp. TaxID=240139 RepID=UPI002AA8ED97|nr:type II toxin-antitoxin system VapC family toxin [uncultured Desulfobacter sp.]
MYMLDTDICIYTIKRKPAQVLKHLQSLQAGMVLMSSITFAELMNGAKKSNYVEDNIRRLEALSEIIEVIPFDKDAAIHYGNIRSDLEKRGMIIGGNDLLIAAHAVSRDLVLVTNNTRGFSRVSGLQFENWAAA